jgi:hypothetical protein
MLRRRRKKADQEAASSGAPVYHHERSVPFTPPSGADPRVRAAIEAEYHETFGPDSRVYHEILSDLVHLDVYIWDPTDERPMYTLATIGMSELPMSVPPEGRANGVPDRAELVMCLPSGWPVPAGFGAAAEWQSDDAFFPIRWLKTLARLPHEYDTWLSVGHSVPNGDPPVPFTDFTHLCAWVLLPPLNVPDSFDQLVVPDVGPVAFFGVYALHADELDQKLTHGIESLIEGFERDEVSELLQPDRPSTLRR